MAYNKPINPVSWFTIPLLMGRKPVEWRNPQKNFRNFSAFSPKAKTAKRLVLHDCFEFFEINAAVTWGIGLAKFQQINGGWDIQLGGLVVDWIFFGGLKIQKPLEKWCFFFFLNLTQENLGKFGLLNFWGPFFCVWFLSLDGFLSSDFFRFQIFFVNRRKVASRAAKAAKIPTGFQNYQQT